MKLTGIRSLADVELEGRAVFVRVDFNIPLSGTKITDDSRIHAALPTINFLREAGAIVVLASHLGRPQGKVDQTLSLEPVAVRLAELLEIDILFTDDCVGDGVKKVIRDANGGDVILLENLRFRDAEKANDPLFAKALADLADVYVNDAFGTSHRKHASTYGMVKHFATEDVAMGMLVRRELEFLTPLVYQAERPYVAIMGGAKVSDKITVIESLLGRVDYLLIGGAMSYTFLAAQDIRIGKSMVERDRIELARTLLHRAERANTRILLPVDHGVSSSFESNERRDTADATIAPDDIGLDIGPKTIEAFKKVIALAKTVVWNGPVGIFEREPFDQGTFAIAEAMADNQDALTVVGGGDSAAAMFASGRADDVTHVSTGGGASLNYLEGAELPGIAALRAGHRFE